MLKNLKWSNRKGFTLAEVMITTVVLCAITMICIPVVIVSRPNSEKVLLRKAYNITSEVIADLISNERFYPPDVKLDDINPTAFAGNKSFSGFLNYNKPANDSMLEYSILDSFSNGGSKAAGCQCYTRTNNKLSVLFCCSLNTIPSNKGVCTTTGNKTTCDFETIDGIHWLTVDSSQTSKTTSDLEKPVFNITVDVDNKVGGKHKQITDSGYRKTRFVFNVYYDGKIAVDSDAQNILADEKSNKIILSEKNTW